MATLGRVRVSSIEAAVRRQVGQFKQNVSNMVKRVMRACWRRIRRRMVAERMTGPRQKRRAAAPGSPLSKRTGNAIRSLAGFVLPDGDGWKLDATIGKGAYYIDQYEDNGRLQFHRIAREEIEKAQAEIRQNYAVLAKLRGQGLSSDSASLIERSDQILSPDAGRNALLLELRSENRARRDKINARQRALRAKDSGQRAFKRSTSGFGSFGIPTTFAGVSP